MTRFVRLDQVDHTGANPRKTLVNLDAIIRVFPVSERHCFVVTAAYNREEAEAASRNSGRQSSGLYVQGSLDNLLLSVNMAASA